jgi:hypothetical protein
MKTLTTIKKEYEVFIESIPNQINKVKKLLKKEKLDYSLNEIDNFQTLFEKYMIDPSVIQETNESLDNVFVAYVGTAFLWHFGGEWGLDKSKKSSCYGDPYVVTFLNDYRYRQSVFPEDWAKLIRMDRFEESLANIFNQKINYYANKPKAIIKPIRNIY